MTISSAVGAQNARLLPRSTTRTSWLLLAIVAAFGFQAALVFLQPVNWDEFRYLADVHQFARGEQSEWLQTFHVRLFAWLTWLPGNEVDQVLAGRFAMLCAEAATVWLVYRCGRAFMAPDPALFAVLCYLASDFVVRHGASFRSDPLAALFLMGALAVLLAPAPGRRHFAAAGALAAVAAMVTVKAVFFLPTLVLCAWWGAADNRARLLVAGVAGIGTFLLLALLHASGLTEGDSGAGAAVATHGFRKTIADAGLLPRGSELLTSVSRDPWLWGLLGAGLVFAVRALRQRATRLESMALMSFAAPLLALLFYRNAFPYFYALILAPAVLLAGFAASRFRRDDLYPAAALLLVTFAGLHAVRAASPGLSVQRAHVEAVHAMFPRPVSYLDRASMIAGFPQAGFFMSSWGMENYREAGRPVMAAILAEKAPVFVIADVSALSVALTGEGNAPVRLFRSDEETLRANFVPHWGLIWVAGKRFEGGPAPVRFDLPVAGPYRIEAAMPVRLDGRSHQPGAVVRLGRGAHSILTPASVTLRYDAPRVAQAPPVGPIFGDLR